MTGKAATETTEHMQKGILIPWFPWLCLKPLDAEVASRSGLSGKRGKRRQALRSEEGKGGNRLVGLDLDVA